MPRAARWAARDIGPAAPQDNRSKKSYNDPCRAVAPITQENPMYAEGDSTMRWFTTVSLAGILTILLALASPVSAATDPGGETLSGSKRCPAGKTVKIVSYANGSRIEHKWSKLGGGTVHTERFVGGLGYELRGTDTRETAVFYTIHTYDWIGMPVKSDIHDGYAVCYPQR